MNYILRGENAVYYECGFSCDNEIFLKLGSEAFFITDGRYDQEAKERIKNAEVFKAKDLIKCARWIIKKAKIKKIVYDPKDWSVDDFKRLTSKLPTYFMQQSNFSQKKRIVKNKEEIALIKEAVRLGGKAFDEFASFLRDFGLGRSEKNLNFEAISLLCRYGELELSFAPIIALNENAAKPHALPTDLS